MRHGHPAELPVIASNIGHVVFDDQVMLRIHDGLNVVADRAGSFASTGHAAGIRAGQRQLFVRFVLQPRLDLCELSHPVAQKRDLHVQPHGLHIEPYRAGSVCGFSHVEISLYAFLNLLPTLVDLAGRVVSVTAVHSLELGAVDCHHVAG
jgi:hypothetical protein